MPAPRLINKSLAINKTPASDNTRVVNKVVLGSSKNVGKSSSEIASLLKDIATAPARKISKIALERMAKNLNPYDYANESYNNQTNKVEKNSAVERAYRAIVLNKKEPERADTEKYIERGYGMVPGVAYKERTDLLQMLAGLPQKYNSIQPSQYRPTVGDDNVSRYYSSKGIEDLIIKELNPYLRGAKDKPSIEAAVEKYVNENNNQGIRSLNLPNGKTAKMLSTTIPGLSTATYSIGEDDKGAYISYSDTWDLDPTHGVLGEKPEGVVGVIKKAAADLVNMEAKPPKLYGRIYIDKKTGKPVR